MLEKAEGFYAINNQFLTSGPKGFTEFKMLVNEDMFVRMDLPGVPEEGVRVFLDPFLLVITIQVSFSFLQSKFLHSQISLQHINTSSETCSKTKPNKLSRICYGVNQELETFLAGPGFREDLRGTDPNGILLFNFMCGSDPALTGPVLQPHPMAFPLTTMAYESKQLPDGKLHVRVDMPGVPSDNFTVSVTNGRVKVTGEAPAVGHHSSGRFYSGDVAMLSTPVDIPSHRIETIAKNGVIGLLIPPFC
ncbi:putative 57 kDa heat shock protein [Arabidopsis lyrata subsp. lyrata]|uniref:putative 57 kDa heat shock protein n=1 Tax=Arabidopsis lyrata subsp. lyrata TaxID=81972 RepID=UPI000A29A4EE|nr:putative 57 kDa heat shock protein [Arabidopsis lyrata subsp. lyrata]|eukprot:XP_020872643.1 putative 57 kDa heat shock protein [Arabidopsis lyrata subsp. lyrata]